MPLPIGAQTASPAPELESIRHRLEKIRDDVAKRISDLEKSRSRARFVVGEIVLDDPELLALVSPHLARYLPKLGSARKVIDEYPQTIAKIAELKKLLP